MGVEARLDDRGEQVVRGVEVVADRVALVPRRLHRVRRRALLGEVHDGVGLATRCSRAQQPVVVLGDVEAVEADLAAGQLPPGGEPGPQRARSASATRPPARRRRCGGEVVDDGDVVARGRQVQRRRPAAEAVAAEDQYSSWIPSASTSRVSRSCAARTQGSPVESLRRLDSRKHRRRGSTGGGPGEHDGEHASARPRTVTSRKVTAAATGSPAGKMPAEQRRRTRPRARRRRSGRHHDEAGGPGHAGRPATYSGGGAATPETATCTSTAAAP